MKLARINKSVLTLCVVLGLIILFQRKMKVNLCDTFVQHDGKLNESKLNETSISVSHLGHSFILPSASTKKQMQCTKGENLVGPLHVNKQETTWEKLKIELPFMENGGAWSPTDCIPTVKLALIIPYRDRQEHLKIFLRQIHPMLQRQRINYRIFVIEQADNSSFNRGKLMNVGYKESLKYHGYDCFVFHDVDLIPESDKNYYGCHISPAHLSVAVDKFNYKLLYTTLFGGAEMFTKADFEKINGFSNIFWGWGAEDDNLYQRTVLNGLTLKRPSVQHARYQMIKHQQAQMLDKRHDVYKQAVNHIKEDGLNSLKYRLLDRIDYAFYTQVKVDLEESKDTIVTKDGNKTNGN